MIELAIESNGVSETTETGESASNEVGECANTGMSEVWGDDTDDELLNAIGQSIEEETKYVGPSETEIENLMSLLANDTDFDTD